MFSENHVGVSISEGLVHKDKLMYLRWGEDMDYVSRFCPKEPDIFTFITTGKAFRDFKTLCSAFKDVEDAKLLIYTSRTFAGRRYDTYLNNINIPNLEVVYSDQIDTSNSIYNSVLDFLFSKMSSSSCALSICEDLNFGVGYTQILDSMACGLPIIATYNKDNPIDIDKEKVGITVKPYDVDGLREAMRIMITNKAKYSYYSNNAKKLIINQYDIRNMVISVLRVMAPHLR